MKKYSNQEACVIYTLNKINERIPINNGQFIQKYGGITFEMERQPNYLHEDRDVLDKDYFSVTSYEII